MPKGIYKRTETHKLKIGLANSIVLKGHKINENQKRGLEIGRLKCHTEEANKKRVETRRKNNNYSQTKESRKKIKLGLEKRFPNGRPTNFGCFKKGRIAPNKGKYTVERKIIKCLYCGKEHTIRVTENKKFCNILCSTKHIKKNKHLYNFWNRNLKADDDIRVKNIVEKMHKGLKKAREDGTVKKKTKNLKKYNCIECDKEILSYVKPKFCSYDCRYKNMTNRENRVCPTCDKTFNVTINSPKKFCSQKCIVITPETIVKIRKKRLRQIFPVKNTKIEIKMKDELEKRDLLKYFKQHKSMFKYWQSDFTSNKFKLIVECDGDYWHNREDVKKRDKIKNKLARENGYLMLRFWESEINKDIEGCVDIVNLCLYEKGDSCA